MGWAFARIFVWFYWFYFYKNHDSIGKTSLQKICLNFCLKKFGHWILRFGKFGNWGNQCRENFQTEQNTFFWTKILKKTHATSGGQKIWTLKPRFSELGTEKGAVDWDLCHWKNIWIFKFLVNFESQALVVNSIPNFPKSWANVQIFWPPLVAWVFFKFSVQKNVFCSVWKISRHWFPQFPNFPKRQILS